MKELLENSVIYKPKIMDSQDIDGFALNYGFEGDPIEISKKGWITSFDPDFNASATQIVNMYSNEIGINKINALLVLIRDKITYVFNNFPITKVVYLSNAQTIKAGTIIYKNQLIDILRIKFEDKFYKFEFYKGDKIIYLFRNEFNFGLYYNFLKNDNIDIVEQDIAKVYNLLDYNHIFSTLNNDHLFPKIFNDGWFPFISLIRFDNFKHIIEYYNTTESNKNAILFIKLFYNEEVLLNIMERWWCNTALQNKKTLLESGVRYYLSNTKDGYIASIKILITEIEGILRLVIKDKLKNTKILSFIEKLKEMNSKKYNSEYSLVLPSKFIDYITISIYGNFDDSNIPDNRNSISHGVAREEQYSWERALQIILTIDHLVYFL